jgi:FKBP-type peptidyl-prolyl cis-trans isomerase
MSNFFKAFFIFIFYIGSCNALELSSNQGVVLEKFFRIMVENSEAGYVLYNKKPVCIHGYHLKDHFTQENDFHLESVCIKEGALILKEFGLTSHDADIIIHVYNDEDSLANNSVHLLFINKKLFIETVQESIALFQYVLGPDITPEALLSQLIDPNKNFHSVLKDDKALIGILLGFGTQNSLYVSRLENIGDSLLSAECPPFKRVVGDPGLYGPGFSHLLLVQESPSEIKNPVLSPSFGYSSLKEESEEIARKLKASSPQLSRNTPFFIFGRLKNDKKTDALVAELEITQDKINKLLQSKSFLEGILQLVYPSEKILLSSSSTAVNASDETEIPAIVAESIHEAMDEQDSIYYVLGMRDAEKGITNKHKDADHLKHQKLKALIKIKSNLHEADQFFHQLHTSSSHTCVESFKLYTKVIKEGEGPQLKNQTKISIHYTIKTAADRLVADTWIGGRPAHIDLSDTISGFAHGVKGMRVGETREIFIHPSLAYGIYTTFDKGIYLKVQAQLVGMDDSCKKEFPKLSILNLQSEIYPNMEIDCAKEAKKVAYSQGYKIWEHYKKCKQYTLEEIIDLIEQIQKGKEYEIDSAQKQKIINQLHWKIYTST